MIISTNLIYDNYVSNRKTNIFSDLVDIPALYIPWNMFALMNRAWGDMAVALGQNLTNDQ